VATGELASSAPSTSLLTVGEAAFHGVSVAARAEFVHRLPRVNELHLSSLFQCPSAVKGSPAGTADNAAGCYFSSDAVVVAGRCVCDLAASQRRGEDVWAPPMDSVATGGHRGGFRGRRSLDGMHRLASDSFFPVFG
jgi:hypothetical protein